MKLPLHPRRDLRYLLLTGLLFAGGAATTRVHHPLLKRVNVTLNQGLYEQLGMEELGLDREAFAFALAGWNKLAQKTEKPDLLTIVDLSQSSRNKRLYVIDLSKKTVLFNTYVSHGRNSGLEFAESFGNDPESFKSSLGFYLTGDTYEGDHGLSLRLHGCEPGINDRALQRGIVIHGAEYVSETFIGSHGRLGRSHGCPAVPMELSDDIIGQIREGSCLFVYHPDEKYLERSTLLAGS